MGILRAEKLGSLCIIDDSVLSSSGPAIECFILGLGRGAPWIESALMGLILMQDPPFRWDTCCFLNTITRPQCSVFMIHFWFPASRQIMGIRRASVPARLLVLGGRCSYIDLEIRVRDARMKGGRGRRALATFFPTKAEQDPIRANPVPYTQSGVGATPHRHHRIA